MKWKTMKPPKREIDIELLHTLLLAAKNNPDAEIRARSLSSAIKIVASFKGGNG